MATSFYFGMGRIRMDTRHVFWTCPLTVETTGDFNATLLQQISPLWLILYPLVI